MPIGSSEYSEFLAATAQKIAPELVNQVLLSRPTLDLFKDWASAAGGERVGINIVGDQNGSTSWTDDSGTFATGVDDDIVGRALYDWSNPAVSKTRVPYKTLKLNTSDEQLVNIAKEHLTSAQTGHADFLSNALFQRVKDGALPSGAMLSLDALVSDADYQADPAGDASVPAFTVGDIDPNVAGKEYWQATREEIAKDDATYTDIKQAMRRIDNLLYLRARKSPTNLIVGSDVYDEYENALDEQVRYTALNEGETRFKELRFGNLKVRLDPDCNPKRCYFLNKDSFRFYHARGAFMSAEEPQAVPGTLDFVTPLASIVCLGVNEMRANGLLLRPDTAGGDA